jgi:transposase-like protein
VKKDDEKVEASAAGVESEAAARGSDPAAVRGRPGRRTVAERQDAVLRLLSGRASADQLARQYGVLPETVLGWRDMALASFVSALRSGEGRSERERELEREVSDLKDALSRATVERAVAIRAVEEWKQHSRPSRPTRSRR